MSEYPEHLTDEDLQGIGPIVDGSTRHLGGESILAAVDASDRARQEAHPLLEDLDRAYRAKLEDEQE